MPGRLARVWLCLTALAGGAWWGSRSLAWTCGLLAIVMGSLLASSRRSSGLLLVAAVSTAGGIGFAGAALRTDEANDLGLAADRTRRCAFAARVLEQAGGLGTLAALEPARCSGGDLPHGTVVIDVEPALPTGATVTGEGWVVPLGTEEFDRARYAAGARAVLIPHEMRRTEPRGFWAAMEALRSGLRRAAASSLSDRHAALLLGLTIGDTNGFTQRDLEKFRTAGLTHILAVSGSNVAIVLGAVLAASRRRSYVARLGISLGAVIVFVAVVGPDGSVLRAATMGAVAILAGGWVRPVDPVYSLPFALLVLVAARPTMVTSAGLQLSVAATIGIVLWSSRISNRLRVVPAPISAALGVTLAAQVAVAPLLVFMFERVSMIAPLTNLVAAPGVAAGTVLGMASATAGAFSPTIGRAIAWFARVPLELVLRVADAGSRPSWASAEVSSAWGWSLAIVVGFFALWTLRRHVTPE